MTQVNKEAELYKVSSSPGNSAWERARTPLGSAGLCTPSRAHQLLYGPWSTRVLNGQRGRSFLKRIIVFSNRCISPTGASHSLPAEVPDAIKFETNTAALMEETNWLTGLAEARCSAPAVERNLALRAVPGVVQDSRM